MPGFFDVAEDNVLNHIFGDPAFTVTAPVYLALTTSALTEADTATTAAGKEATYTGYARKAIAAADMSASSGGSKTNGTTLTFANCTAGTSTIIGWYIVSTSSGTSGDLLVFGTCTSTVISTTQTPPTVAAGGLVVTLD